MDFQPKEATVMKHCWGQCPKDTHLCAFPHVHTVLRTVVEASDRDQYILLVVRCNDCQHVTYVTAMLPVQ